MVASAIKASPWYARYSPSSYQGRNALHHGHEEQLKRMGIIGLEFAGVNSLLEQVAHRS